MQAPLPPQGCDPGRDHIWMVDVVIMNYPLSVYTNHWKLYFPFSVSFSFFIPGSLSKSKILLTDDVCLFLFWSRLKVSLFTRVLPEVLSSYVQAFFLQGLETTIWSILKTDGTFFSLKDNIAELSSTWTMESSLTRFRSQIHLCD